MLIIVDAISAIATLDIPLATLPIDILVGASQKALMLPPGLSILSINKRAWDVIDSIPRHSLYFNLPLERKFHQKSTSAWTPAMNIILGLDCTLRMLEEEGKENVFRRHAIAAEATRAGLTALGLSLLSPHNPAPGVTAAKLPSTIDGEKARVHMYDKFGLLIAGGQEELKGKIIRIGHMGYMNAFDSLIALSALEMSLAHHGYSLTPGTAVKSAQEVIARNGSVA